MNFDIEHLTHEYTAIVKNNMFDCT